MIIRNVKLAKPPRSGSILNGYSDTRGIAGVLIEGLQIEGKTITTADEADIYQNHVRELRIEPLRN